jgi:midasin (ATPase involved in ribosome maturation)
MVISFLFEIRIKNSFLYFLNQNREHTLLLNSNMHDLGNEITFKFKEFEHLNIKNIKTNFTQINFEEWKYFEKSDIENAQNLVVEKYVDFDGLKLERKTNSINLSKNEDVDLLKQIVFVETTRKNLNKIVMSIISDNCIVIEGDLSTGKTMLVEYLSKMTNNELIKYQMDDFMDSKSLIGNFVCSEIPGEFLWKAGPLYHVN